MTLGTAENKKMSKTQNESSMDLQFSKEKYIYTQITGQLGEFMEIQSNMGVEKKEGEIT